MFARNNEGKLDYKKIIIESGLYLVLFCMLIAIIIKEPTFLSLRNFKNILTQSSVRTIIALGVAGLIVTQGTDLSAGRQVGLSAVISGTLLQSIIIVRLSMNDVYGLLHGEESIYNTILKQNEYWNVISGREIPLDEVKRLSISELDVGLLPKEDVYFEIVSTKLENYVKKFDTEYFV